VQQPVQQPVPQPIAPQPVQQPVQQPAPQPVQQPAAGKKKKGSKVLIVLLILAFLAVLGGGIFLGSKLFSKDDDDDKPASRTSSGSGSSDTDLGYDQLSFKSGLDVMNYYTDIPFRLFDMDTEDTPSGEYEAAQELADEIIPMFYQPELEYLLEYGPKKKAGDNLELFREFLADGIVEFLMDVESYEDYDEDERSDFDLWGFTYGSPRSCDLDDLIEDSDGSDFYNDYLDFLKDEGLEEMTVYDVWFKDPAFKHNGAYCIIDDIACYRINGKWYLSAEYFLGEAGLLGE
jgi:hypothetical protein